MRLLITIISLLLVTTVIAQHNHNHDDHTHLHEHGEWEIGAALGLVPLFDEGTIAPGVHLHLLQQNKLIDGLMVGIGFESVLDEHTHLNAGLVFNYNIYKGLFAGISPGILWINHDGWESAFVSHFELSYEFEVGKLHIGPIVEYSLSSIDKHMLAGIHVGINF